MALTPLWFQSYFCTVILIFKKLHLILLSNNHKDIYKMKTSSK